MSVCSTVMHSPHKRTRSGSDYQTSDCQTSTPEENPTTAPEVNRSATPDVNRSAMATDALDAAITSLDIDGLATNESLAQMLRGLAQTLTKSFCNIIAKNDDEIRELKVRVTALEEKTDYMEQYSRRNTVRFRGIPETLNEDTDGLVKDVAARKQDVQLTKHDFVRSHRVGRKSEEKDTPRAVIIVRFTSHNTKVAVMRNARKLKGTHIFINEDLTKVRSTIAWEARSLKRESKVADTWTRDGIVFVKVGDNSIKSFTAERLWKVFKAKL